MACSLHVFLVQSCVKAIELPTHFHLEVTCNYTIVHLYIHCIHIAQCVHARMMFGRTSVEVHCTIISKSQELDC